MHVVYTWKCTFFGGSERRTKVTSSVSCITSLSLLNVGIALCLVGQMKSRKLKWKSSVYLITSLSFWNLGTLLSWGGGGGGGSKTEVRIVSQFSNVALALKRRNITLFRSPREKKRKMKWSLNYTTPFSNVALALKRRNITLFRSPREKKRKMKWSLSYTTPFSLCTSEWGSLDV